ncbi:MAG: 50S ribosomal protein L32 [Clostridia bacterium]|jgi:large subunit ribosomal protein L32|nr:50S ribosomal protein L32 [Clostridia bacterium]MBQ5957095.1 50S ribosomal protein L32 [Clostridia bacterium]MBQ6003478.1 50S ribosomal protein L32 [Clostridia bacterium]MBR0438843.1 50S ribosomal protein L32 [Clostridia bacterium]MBR3564024.1 50S ribosomal protein L32 [Clostridia bacterium]
MAVPSRITSKAKARMRKAHIKLSSPNLVECPQCHEPMLAHRVCKNCGYYGGKAIVEKK